MIARRLLHVLCLAASVLALAAPALGATGQASRCARGCRTIVKPKPPPPKPKPKPKPHKKSKLVRR